MIKAYASLRDTTLDMWSQPQCLKYVSFQGAVRPGLGAAHMAVVFKNLLERIGYKKFYVQGGDFGSLILGHMVTIFPEVSCFCLLCKTAKGYRYLWTFVTSALSIQRAKVE